MSEEMREKIAELLKEYAIARIVEEKTGIVVNNLYEQFVKKILSLFDISKVMVEEECKNPKHSKNRILGIDCTCTPWSTTKRPAQWSDIEKGGILRGKE